MSSLAAEYCTQIKDNFKKFFAAFPPNDPLELGDFGILNSDIPTRLGNIKKFGITFTPRHGIAEASLVDFTSKGSVEVEFSAAVEASPGTVPIKAGLEIKFSRENSVFFNAAKCTIDAIEDQVALGEQILKLHEAGSWDKNYVVVTSLMKAASTTIVVSSTSNSSIKFEASTPGVKEIDLADASLKLSIKRFKDVALKIPTSGGLTPLIGLSKIHGGIFSPDDFGPIKLALSTQTLKGSIKAVPAFGSID